MARPQQIEKKKSRPNGVVRHQHNDGGIRKPKKQSRHPASGSLARSTAAVGPLKKQLRDISRLLNGAKTLPADKRIEYERQVQTLQRDLIAALYEKERSEMIGKYHMVRFFERQRAMRNLKRAEKALASASQDQPKTELDQAVRAAQIEVNYALYYPYMVPYHSLHVKTQGEDGKAHSVDPGLSADGTKGSPEMWKAIEAAMANDGLEELRDRVDTAKMEQIQQEVQKMAERGQNASTGATDAEEAEDESGAGFFE